MSSDIPERDWKKLRSLKDAAINLACERIFAKIETLISSRGSESHKYYLELWKTLKKEDKEIGLMFDDFKRSTALLKIAVWKENGILSDDNFMEFSEETRKRVQTLCDIRKM